MVFALKATFVLLCIAKFSFAEVSGGSNSGTPQAASSKSGTTAPVNFSSCAPGLKAWSDQHSSGIGNAGAFSFIGSIFISDIASRRTQSCQQYVVTEKRFGNPDDLRRDLASGEVGNRLSTKANSFLQDCAFEDSGQGRTAVAKYYYAQSRLDSELEKINNELLVGEEFGAHLFRGDSGLALNCDYDAFVAIARQCSNERSKCGEQSPTRFKTYVEQLEMDYSTLLDIYAQIRPLRSFAGGYGAAVETTSAENKQKIAFLQFQESLILAKHPVMNGPEFKAVLEKNALKTPVERVKKMGEALAQQMKADRTRLLDRKKSLLEASNCISSKKGSCSPRDIDVALEGTSPRVQVTSSLNSSAALESQSCVQESVVDRNDTAKTLGSSAVGAFGGIGGLAVKGIAGLGFASRAASISRAITFTAMGVEGGLIGTEVADAAKVCNSQPLPADESPAPNQAPSLCGNNSTLGLAQTDHWIGCMVTKVGTDVAMSVVPGLIAARGIFKANRALAALKEELRAGLTAKYGATRAETILRNMDLSSSARLAEVEKILGQPLSPTQRAKFLEAHNVGLDELGPNGGPAGVGNYTAAQIARKNRLLAEAGIADPAMRRRLLEEGLAGHSPYFKMTEEGIRRLYETRPSIARYEPNGRVRGVYGEGVFVPRTDGSISYGQIISTGPGGGRVQFYDQARGGWKEKPFSSLDSLRPAPKIGDLVNVPRGGSGYTKGIVTQIDEETGEAIVEFQTRTSDGVVSLARKPAHLSELRSAHRQHDVVYYLDSNGNPKQAIFDGHIPGDPDRVFVTDRAATNSGRIFGREVSYRELMTEADMQEYLRTRSRSGGSTGRAETRASSSPPPRQASPEFIRMQSAGQENLQAMKAIINRARAQGRRVTAAEADEFRSLNRRARSFHPDKLSDDAERRAAEEFQKLLRGDDMVRGQADVGL